jgi:hypothetical protein
LRRSSQKRLNPLRLSSVDKLVHSINDLNVRNSRNAIADVTRSEINMINVNSAENLGIDSGDRLEKDVFNVDELIRRNERY